MNITEKALNYIASPEADEMSPRSKLLLSALSFWANEEGYAEVNRRELGRIGSCTPFTVTRAVRDLESRGLVEQIGILERVMKRRIIVEALTNGKASSGLASPRRRGMS